MLKYAHQCVNCEKIYQAHQVPKDLLCTESGCELIGLLVELAPSKNSYSGGTPPPLPGQSVHKSDPNRNYPHTREAGLCVLLMDASGSMFFEPAFPNTPFKSRYTSQFLTRAEMITNVAAAAIFDLQNMVNPENSYVCPILFDHRRHVLFTKSIAEITQEFGTPDRLAKHIFDTMEREMSGGTDINSALQMAHSFVQKFIAGTVPGMGNYLPMKQLVPMRGGMAKDVHNVRVLVYTDGEQLQEYGPIASPFRLMETDLLMGVYIGNPNDKGAQDLRNIISRCPIHGTEQFFSINAPNQMATLKGLFRSASGASGFCHDCIPSFMKSRQS